MPPSWGRLGAVWGSLPLATDDDVMMSNMTIKMTMRMKMRRDDDG